MGETIVINCGVGNVTSVVNACRSIQPNVREANEASDIEKTDIERLILPGVGATGSCINMLRYNGLEDVIKNKVLKEKIPLLGICVGMQLLATECEEFGIHKGLNLIPGKVRRMNPENKKIRIPHVGWNEISVIKKNSDLNALHGRDFYFVHSYEFLCERKYCLSTTEYGREFNSVIKKDNIFGVQFHPEKSSASGMALLEIFLKKGIL